METRKVIMKAEPSRESRRPNFLKRLGIVLLILMITVALTTVLTLLVGTIMQTFSPPQTVQIYGSHSQTDDDHLVEVILKPLKHLLTNSLHLIGFESDHKSRRKRDLNDDNRIQMVDDNRLEKSEESDEDVVRAGFGPGIDGTLQRLTQKNSTLKIIYASPGGEGNRNDIMRSMRKRRRRRKRNAEMERKSRERRYAQEYQELRNEYSRRCKKEAPGEKECSKYCEKFEKFLKEAKHSYKEIKYRLSGLLKECKGKRHEYNFDLSDSFPKRKDKKLEDFDSDEIAGKIRKKDKPKPTVVDQATDSTTLNVDRLTTELTTTTVVSAASDAPVVIIEHNTQNAGKGEKVPVVVEEATSKLSSAELHEALEKFEDNLIEETTVKVVKPSSTVNPKVVETATVFATSTDHNKQGPSLDDLIKTINGSSTNSSVPPPFDAQRHNPVEDDCVKSLDDLMKKIPEFRANEEEHPDCNKTSKETLVRHPEISKFKKQNLKYNPDDHRPKTDECIKSLDDLLEAVDMEHGGLVKPKQCKTSSSTVAPTPHRSAYPDESVDALYEEYGRPPPPFHEDQFDQSTLPMEVHDFIMGRSRNRDQFNHDVPSAIESPDSRAVKYLAQPTVAASGPFLNLCDQLRNQQNPAPIKTLSSNQHNFQAQQYGIGQANIPVTGETLKATSQVLLNSAYGGFTPNHFCFYQVPPTYGAMRPVYAGGQNYPAGKSLPLDEEPTPKHLLNDPVIETVIEPRGAFLKGLMNVPLQIQNLSGKRTSEDADIEGAQLLCSLVPPPADKATMSNDTVARQDALVAESRANGHHRHCPRGKVPCADGIQCVLSSHLCDSRVDCFDGSDESHCSCLSRLTAGRRCDGYVDCPLGEDEMGCFGCDKFSYSCFNNFFEHQASHQSETKCFTLIEKCDGFNNCLNRKDEQDCTMLVRDLRSPLAFTVGHSVGVLHRNYKGKWYPVCHNPLPLAKEACEAEIGPLDRDPGIVQHHGDLPGPFIQPNPRSQHVFQPEFTDTCNGLINYVKCPTPKCGSTKQNELENLRIKVRGKRNASEVVQIVGGTQAEPNAFPFIVAVFRDGKFHCGGSIVNEHWIVSAAHCCDNFPRHHYELRAGLLRRRSFSPQVQVSTVTHVVIHRGYNPQKMMNDISLMHSDKPFQYNRWVRPICLPERHMTTNDRDWVWGPRPGTMCTAVGWGALREHGGSPDHLMQVTVPILPVCKHKNDRDGLAICAAETEGGHDACQGDSGGPFACVSISSPHEWYLAGVVSHGEGCARPNEPGVYTRVALFNDWITKKTSEVLPPSSTRLICPGFQCSVGVSLCISRQKRCNGKVDCLGGEDELNCSLDQLLAESIMDTTIASAPVIATVPSATSTASSIAEVSSTPITSSTIEASSTPNALSTPEVSSTTTTSSTTESSSTSPVHSSTTEASVTSKIDFLEVTPLKPEATSTTTVETVSTSTDEVHGKDIDVQIGTSTEGTTELAVTVSGVTTETSANTSPVLVSSEEYEDSIAETEHTTAKPSSTSTSAHTTLSSATEDAETTTQHSPVAATDTSTIAPCVESTSAATLSTSTLSMDHHLFENHSATTESTTETSFHLSKLTTEKSSSSAASPSIEPSHHVDTMSSTEGTTPSAKPKEIHSSETTSASTTLDYTTVATTQSDHFHNTTDSIWIQVNDALAKLKPQSPSINRDFEDQYLMVGTALIENATSTYTTESNTRADVTVDPSSASTETSTLALHHDLDHSETQIESVKGDTSTTSTMAEHPFFKEIHDLVEEKTRRLNQFRLSMHYLHTSLKNQSVDAKETSYKYKPFVCSKIRQSINIAHHCDRIIDCEDGTDELRCTCRDYLKDKYDFLICDGKTDCLDLTDEENCFSCDSGQYPCRMSKVCIDEKKLCDTIPDCPLHEDELDCLALTDGHKVYFDANNLSEFKYEGLVTKNTNGTWDLICGVDINNSSVESIGKICSFLGFAGYRGYYQITLVPLANDTVDMERKPLLIMSYRNISSEPDCKALHITCMPFINATEHEISHFENQHKEQPVQVNIRPVHPIESIHTKAHITFHENAHIEFIENFGDDYDWPWNADIYLEGVFLCSAIIIDANWIVVDSSCMRLINLKNDYLSVVAGGAKSYLKIAGPYEQVVRVNCYHFLPDARVVMLHLAKNLTFTRHVLPTFIPEKNHNIGENQCLAVGQDKYGRTRTLRVHLNMTNCQPEKHICYQLDPDKGIYHADHCYSEDATRTGVVVCKSNSSGWYPVGFYQNKHGLCGFNEVVKMISLKEFYTDIQHELSHRKCDYDFPEPLCAGLRCRYGKCIGHSLVCDNKLDCDDNSDERPEACNARNDTSTACLPTQFRCGNQQCVDKGKFCDGKNDCGDLSDEPHECSCYTYLKATDPTKICDGVRNCWDKSDENARLCKCQKTSFQCGDSDTCIPHDHVCDGENDCPGSEDERFCYALQQNPAETNFGEVMQQSYGIWHSKCFPKNDKYDNQTIKEICNRVGYHQIRKVFGRKMLPESRLRTANRTNDPVDRIRGTATKAVVLNKFSKVVINEKQTVYMKPSRPLFTLVNWDAEDEQKCDRLEISCGD